MASTAASLSRSETASNTASPHKRVSFGSQPDGTVTQSTHVYDTSTQSTSRLQDELQSQQAHFAAKAARSQSDCPPSVVTVSSGQSDFPVPIRPPANTSSQGANHIPVVAIKRVEMDAVENPFRPEGELNHQVDPIVEQFKTKPYGGTNSAPGTPEKHATSSANQSTVIQHQQQLQQSAPPTASDSPDKGSPKKKDSSKKGRKGSKDTSNGAGSVVRPSQVELQVNVNDNANGTFTTVVDPKRTTLASPKAGKVELVHLEEKKKKCGCCAIQ